MRARSTFTALAIVILSAAGCSKDDETKGRTITIDTPEGKTTYRVDESGDQKGMTIEGPQGKITYGAANKEVLAALEGLLYPGLALTEGGAMHIKDGTRETATGNFTSSDAIDAVVAHYKKALPDATVVSMGEMTAFSGKTKAGADFSINILPNDEGKTTVMVTLVKQP